MTAELEKAWTDAASGLRGFIRSRVRDHFAAEDILQDVFLRAHRRLGQVRQPGRLQGWLFQIARNAVSDYYRKQRSTEEVSESLAADGEEIGGMGVEEVERLKGCFRGMVTRLPEPYREALVLTEFEGWSQKELAARKGISISGAKSRVQRGRQMLKRDLLDCCEFELDARRRVIDYRPRSGECVAANLIQEPGAE